MYDLARLIPNPTSLERLQSLLEESFNDRQSTRGYEIFMAIGDEIPRSMHRILLSLLRREGVLKVIRMASDEGEGIYSIDLNACRAFFEEEISAAKVLVKIGYSSTDVHIEKVRLAATLPEGLDAGERIDRTDEAIRRIILSARDELWVVSPYFDEFGKDAIKQAVVGRASKGTKVMLISRQLSPTGNDQNQRSYDAIKGLVHELEKCGLESMLEVREFTRRGFQDGNIRSGLHSKIILADSKICYIGSSNLTEWSLDRNFELGVVLEDEIVSRVREILKILWLESLRVEMQ